MTAAPANAVLKARLTIIALFVLFLAPMVLAWLMVNNIITWRPSGTKEHGDLIKPPVSLRSLKLEDGAGAAVALTGHLGTWTILYLGPAQCDDACAKRVLITRQIRLAVGKELPRVRRLYLAPPGAQPLEERLRRANPDLTVVHGGAVPDSPLAMLRRRIHLEPNQILFVDAQGYAMMRYRLDQPARGILKDLQLLLRASQTE